MNPDPQTTFDGGCIGRPKQAVLLAQAAYARLETTLAPRQLQMFNASGYDRLDLANLLQDASLESLRFWRGMQSFAKDTVDLLGCDDPSFLVAYGKTTIALFRLVLSACEGHRVLWTDDFYQPWDVILSDADARGLVRGSRMNLRSLVTDRGAEPVIQSVVDAARQVRPTVVVLSTVTQGGIRLPVERIVARILEFSRGDPPLVVLDGCQAFGRVETDLGKGQLARVPCAYIGCFHKAMRGPKGMGFLVCNDASWRRTLNALRSKGSDWPDLAEYGRSNGTHLAMPTHAVDRVVGAAASMEGVKRADLRSRELRVTINHIALERGLVATDWKVVTPSHADWRSGIVLLQPPIALPSAHRHARKEALEDAASGGLVVDELRGMIRVALDPEHPADEGGDLAKRLANAISELPQ